MKKLLTILLVLLLLVGTLAACAASSEPEITPTPNTEDTTPTTTPTPEEPEAQEEPPADTFSIEQIQLALQPQFQVGDWGEGNPEVISAVRVERDRDYMYSNDTCEHIIDLSNAYRYRVEIRFRQSLEDYTMWSEIYADFDVNPFRRDGDYTILTDYFYFNDVNGTPELPIVLC